MVESNDFYFENFQLDVPNECLWREQEALPLTPKTFAVLRYLIEHANQLVTRADLLEAIWPDAVVGHAVLTVGIAELRKVLGDDPQAPRFIETVHRRGYRFLPAVTTAPLVQSSRFQVPSSSPPSTSDIDREKTLSFQPGTWNLKPETFLVGRESELSQLQGWLAKAMSGERQIVFVTGEAGIGKTALIEAFLLGNGQRTIDNKRQGSTKHLQPIPDARPLTPGLWVGWGQCIEHYGGGEAYLPVFLMLSQLFRTPIGPRLREILDQYAPSWLVQMPAVLDAAAREALQIRTQGVTRERMLREMAEAIEALTTEHLFVLVLEDLHWSDYATLDLLSFLARRRHPARLLVLGTYRPVDAMKQDHPLRPLMQDLRLRGQCEETALERLSLSAVEEYLTLTFPQRQFPTALTPMLHKRTNGTPLFFVKVVQDWVNQGVLTETSGKWELQGTLEEATNAVPRSLREMIEWQIGKVDPHLQLTLEAASVVGEEFTAALVAAAVNEEETSVEQQCEDLARRGQVLEAREATVWPDGSITAGYRFTHALYQQVLYERLAAARRMRWHQQIGRRLEQAYGEHVADVAAGLALHFERGREYKQALRYLEQAARKALRRSAPHEAIQHLRTALRLLDALPETAERVQQELTLQALLAPALMAAKGYDSLEVEQVYARVRVLAQQIEESPQLFPVLGGVTAFYIVRAEYRTAHELAEQLLRMAQHTQDPELLVEAHTFMGVVQFYLGEFISARAHLEQGLAFYDLRQHGFHAMRYGQDPWVACQSFLAWALWCLGYAEQALRCSQEAIAYAQELKHPLSLAFAFNISSILYNMRRDAQAGHAQAEATIALGKEHGLPYWVRQGVFARGRALVQGGKVEEGLVQLQEVAHAFRQGGKGSERPAQLTLLAEAYLEAGQLELGLQTLAEAQTAASRGGECYWEAEMYRLKGALLLAMQTSERRNPTPRVG